MNKRIKIVVCAVLCAAVVWSMCGCGLSSYLAIEKPAYQAAINSLMAALDNGDANAVYELFSPAVREAIPELKARIEELLEVYSGPTDEIGWDGLLGGSYSTEDGKQVCEASTEFPVRSGDAYYWFYVSLMYVNTANESQVGITNVRFFTGDENILLYESLKSGEAGIRFDKIGLEVFTERKTDSEIRCIYGDALRYSSATKALDIDEVKAFFSTSNSFDEFKARYGEPNAADVYYYYELPEENGEPRYLCIGDNHDGTVYWASIVDDFVYIATVFDEEA